MTTKEVLGG